MARSGVAIEAVLAALVVGGLAVGEPWPLQIAVATLHEGAHAAMAVATGGVVVESAVDLTGAGHTVTQGGWTVGILAAGYCAPLVWGASLIGLARHPTWARVGCLLAAATFAPLILAASSSVAVPAVVAVGAWAALAVQQRGIWRRRGCRIAGLMLAVQGCIDLIGDLATDATTHDTAVLADHTGISEFVWAVSWLATTAAVIYGLSKNETTA